MENYSLYNKTEIELPSHDHKEEFNLVKYNPIIPKIYPTFPRVRNKVARIIINLLVK